MLRSLQLSGQKMTSFESLSNLIIKKTHQQTITYKNHKRHDRELRINVYYLKKKIIFKTESSN